MVVEAIKEVIDAFHVLADMGIAYQAAHLKANLVLILQIVRALQLPPRILHPPLSILQRRQPIHLEFPSHPRQDHIAI